MKIITKEYIENHKTPKGGYSICIFKALGVKFPVKKGWKKQIIGKPISEKNHNWLKKLTRKACG